MGAWVDPGPWLQGLFYAGALCLFLAFEMWARRGAGRARLVLRAARIWVVLALFTLAASLACPPLRRPEVMFSVILQISIKGILALGMTFCILSAGIDLSVGALLAMAGCVCGWLIRHGGWNSIGGAWAAAAVALLVGTTAGCANGLVISRARMQPFIVTLAMMSVARGVAFWITGGRPIVIDSAPERFLWLGGGKIPLPGGLLIPVPAVLFLALALVASWTLRRTAFGRYVYAIGGNEEAARLSGIAVDRVKLGIYAISGLASAVAGLVAITRQQVANYELGMTYELDAIAAVVIGGTSLSGGVGGVGGTVAGALLLGILSKVLSLKGVQDYVQWILTGLIVVGAVYLARRR